MKPELWTCTNEEYHADRSAESHSTLERFRRDPAEYAAWRADEIVSKPSDEMLVGSMLHSFVLEPWDDRYVVAPECDRRTKEGKAIYQQFIDAVERRPVKVGAPTQVVRAEQFDLATAMAKAVQRHPLAFHLLETQGEIEQAIRWTSANGVALKCKPDKIVRHEAGNLIVDLKTTTDARAWSFSASCNTWGYHRQAAHYLDGVRAMFGGTDRDWRFVHVVVAKAPPHRVRCYTLEFPALALGRQQNEATLRRLAECRESGVWEEAGWDRFQSLDLPRYAYMGENS